MSNSLLLIALLLLVLAHPFFPAENLAHVVFLVTVSAVLVGAIWAVSRQRRVLVASLSLAAPTFTASWLQHFIEPLAHHGLPRPRRLVPRIYSRRCAPPNA